MNDKMEVVMRLVAADWPNCSKGEILEHLPDMVEVADALLAAAGEQDRPITADDVKADPNLFTAMFADKRQVAGIIARAEAAEAKVAALEAKLAAAARLAQDSAEAAGEAMEAVQSDASVIVIPGGDWTRLVELVSGWFPTHSCDDGDCQDCREDAEIKAIIARAEEANG